MYSQVVLILTVLTSTAFAPLCDFPDDYSAECQVGYFGMLEAEDSDELNDYLDTYCSPECYDALDDGGYFECLSSYDENYGGYFSHTACSNNGEEYCLAKDDEHDEEEVPLEDLSTCNASCVSTCTDALEELKDQLGCCAASFFKYDIFFNASVYEMCEVDLGDLCESGLCLECGTGATLASAITVMVLVGVANFII